MTLQPAIERARASGALVGRQDELRVLADAWRRTGPDAPAGLLLVQGEPGAGKTRLAAEQAVRVHEQGGLALFGRCDLEVPAPFRPWLAVITELLREADDALIAAHGGELARLVGGAPAPAPDTDPEVARLRLLSAAVGLIGGVAARRPLLIILDDLHVADRATLLLLRELLQGPDASVLVLATVRDIESEHSEAFRGVLGELLREPTTQRLAVGGLDLPATRALVVAELGETARADALAETVIADTDGNPLFAIELLRHLAEAGGESALPGTITEVVNRRAAALGDDAARVLRYAAALGRSFEFALLVHVTQTDEDAVLDALERACRAALVSETRGSAFQFTHAVIQHALAAELSDVRSRRLHRRAAEWLAAASERDAVRTGELALHWASAGSEFTEQAVAAAVEAGEHALAVLALDDAVRAFARALSLHQQSGGEPDEQTIELMLRLGEAERRAGHDGFRDRLLAAAELAQQRGDTTRLVRAALANSRGITADFRATDARRVAVLEAALDAVGTDNQRDRALLLAALATELYAQRDRRLALADEALALARSAGDESALAEILYRRCMSVAEPATVADRIALTGELVRLGERLDQPMVRFRAAVERARVLFEAGRADAITEHRRVIELAPATGSAFAHYLASTSRALLLHREGRLDEAEAEALRGAERAAGLVPDWSDLLAGQLVPIRWDQGRLGEFADFAIAAAEQSEEDLGFRALIPLTLFEAGREEEARAALEAGVAEGMAVEMNTVYIVAAALWSEACVRLGHLRGAEIWLERLRPWREQYVYTGVSLMGSVARLTAGLAALLGRRDEAERDFALAERVDERIGAPGPLARTLIDYGTWLGDRERLERARDLAARYGFPRLLAAAEAGLGTAPATPATGPIPAALVREGDVWTLTFDGRVTRLKDAKGLAYLVRLLRAPGVEQHALELVGNGATSTAGAEEGLSVRADTGDAGPALDPQAKAEYRARVEALREEIEEAEAFNDPERLTRAREELEWIGRSLSQAVGLGGRDRPQSSDAERARVNVTRAIRALVKRIAEHDDRAARVLDATVRTGIFCLYAPDPDRPIEWSLPD